MRLRRGLPALLAFAFITGAFLGAVVIGSLYADRERDQIIITRADTPMEAAARVAGCLGRAPGAGGELDEMPLGPAKLLRMVRPALSLGVCEVSPSTLRMHRLHMLFNTPAAVTTSHRILNHAVQGSAACRPSIRLATIPVECPFPGDLLMGSEENRQALLAKGRSEADLMLVASEADREVRLNGQTLLGLSTRDAERIEAVKVIRIHHANTGLLGDMYQIEGQVLLRRDAHSARQLRDFHIVAFDDGVGHLRFFPSADAEPVGAAREEAGADSSAGSPGEEVPGPPVKRVFFILSHWDRPDQLRRWMHSIRRVRASDPQVGICLANFLAPSTNPRRNKVVLGASTLATITHADLVEWTGVEDALLVEFGPELPFSKTRAFNACFQALAAGVRPRADDILFFTDVDIQLPAGIGHELRRFVRTGWQAFAPVVRYEHCEWVYGSGPPPGYLGEGDDQPIAERIAGRPLATDEVHDGAIFSSAPRRHRARRSDYFDPPANVSPGSEEYEEMVELPDGPGPWATGPDAPDSASEDADGANGDPASGPGQMAVSPEERLTAGDRAEDLRTADWAADDRCWGDGGYGLVAMAAADFYRLAAGNGFTASGGPGGRQGTNVDPAEASHIWDAAVDQLAEELEEHICLRIAGAITKVREPALPSIPPGLLVRATGGQAVACPAAVAGRQATHRRGDMTGGGYRVGALHWDVPRRGAQAEAGSKPRAGGEHTPEDLPAGAGGTPVAEDDEPEQAPAPAGAFAGLQRTTAGPYRVDLFDRRAGFEDTDTLLRAKRLPVCITRRRHPQLLHSWHPPSRWNFVRNKPGLGAGAGGAEAFHSATNVC